MGMIFYFSSKTAADSSEQSGFFVRIFESIFGRNEFSSFIVRKAAHCLEFAGLSFLFSTALYTETHKRHSWLAIVFTSLYAVTDEIHQLFVDGRSCQITDWAVDTFGAMLGAGAFLIIFFAIIKIIEHKSVKTVDSDI